VAHVLRIFFLKKENGRGDLTLSINALIYFHTSKGQENKRAAVDCGNTRNNTVRGEEERK
jgi:hypothetical protein